MKNYLILILLLFFTFEKSMAQNPASVQVMDVNPNGTTEIAGDLAEGQVIKDLSWAANSAIACFPATQNAKFSGNHLFYTFQIPTYAEVNITLVPDDPGQDMSLYGYQLGVGKIVLPERLTSCVSCEADHKWDYPKKGQTQDHTRHIFFNSTTNEYQIMVGVTGPAGTVKGGFRLLVEMKSRVEAGVQEKLTIYRAGAEKGKTLMYKGNLANGTPIQDLSWAANSSVACFPATQNTKFRGNHVFYVTEIPAHSEMTIRVIPTDPNANFSLYAYQDATTSEVFPPELQRCVSCEADHKWDYPKRGQTQDHTRSVKLNAIQNPYRVVIGVAGVEGVTEGEFRLEIAVQ